MFVIKRNQVVVTALAVMIAAAGYLNFQESRSSEGKQTALQLTEEGDVTALVDYSALPDDADTAELDPITAETTGDGAAVYVSAGQSSAYFAEAKLNREQSRAKEKDILAEMLKNENLTEAQKDKCTESMLTLQKRMEKESAAEAMLQSKGFAQAYVRMDDETVDVVVDATSLSEKEVAQIEDIVQRKTGMTADKIRISTLQK
nr:SpoIIIAH-like family protein [uncultured Anaerotignum sp.]